MLDMLICIMIVSVAVYIGRLFERREWHKLLKSGAIQIAPHAREKLEAYYNTTSTHKKEHNS